MEQGYTSDFIRDGKMADAEMLEHFGTTSIAYKVRIDGQLCFMKKLRPELQNDSRYRHLFHKEFNTGKDIDNPYVVRYLDIMDGSDGLCIITEYVKGRTLKEKVEKEPEYFRRKENIEKLLLQLCKALRALHRENVVHLDINPGNIIISQTSNDIKLVDLGFCLSNWDDETAGSTKKFGAPEAAINDINEIDARSDIYSIGRLLQFIEERANAKFPAYIKRIKRRCLRKQKRERYNSCDEIIHEIESGKRKKWFVAAAIAAAMVVAAPLAMQLYEAVENYIAWESGKIADKFEEDGIFYLITDRDARTVEVTYKGRSPIEYGFEYGDGEIKIPATVTHRGRTFKVTSIGTEVFDNPETTSIIMPEGLETIKDRAFDICRLTGTVRIPSSVTHIGEWNFVANNFIDSILVDKSNPRYDSRGGCNAIIETATNTLMVACNNTVIPKDVVAIGNDAFVFLQKATFTIPQSVRSIGSYAFHNSAIKSIALPDSLTRIGEYAFMQCMMLQQITLPAGLDTIETGAFRSSGLQEIALPDNVSTVGDKAFSESRNLQSAIIGSSVRELGAYAFENCEKLTKVVSHIPAEELRPTGSGCFNGIDKKCILYVPRGAAKTYRSTYGWNTFAKIVEME